MMMLFLFSACSDQNTDANNSTDLSTRSTPVPEYNTCYQDNLPNNCFFPNTASEIVLTLSNFPQYPGCTFDFKVRLYDCFQATGLQLILVESFQLIAYSCPDFYDDIDDFLAGTTPVGIGLPSLADFYRDFNNQALQLLEVEIISYYSQLTGGLCGPLLTIKGISWYFAACMNYCTYLDNRGMYNYLSISCGENCCIRFTNIICDPTMPTNYQLETTYNTTDHPLNCGRPGYTPPGFCINTTSCTFTCQQ